jgi:hypothetical protein
MGSVGSATLRPIKAAWVIAHPDVATETITYLLSDSIACNTISTSGWLPTIAAGTQVLELVVNGSLTSGTANVGTPGFLGGAEVNYGVGGAASGSLTSASSGSITIVSKTTNGPLDGQVNAIVSGGMVSGAFHAEYCATGQIR